MRRSAAVGGEVHARGGSPTRERATPEHPQDRTGLGELFVFVFFGLVAVVGTTYVQTETWLLPSVYAAVGVGAIACAILAVGGHIAPEALERPGFDAGYAVEFWDITNRQDWELCANAYLGAFPIAAAASRSRMRRRVLTA